MSSRDAIIQHLRDICRVMPAMPDDASYVHQQMLIAFHEAGYSVFNEYVVRLDDGRSGRIDIVLQASCGRWVAIEIDARRPRKRSIAKLGTRNWIRISCLRGVEGGPSEYPGVDAIIALPVRLATFEEKSKKAPIASIGRALRGSA